MNAGQVRARLLAATELLGHGPFRIDKDGDPECETCSTYVCLTLGSSNQCSPHLPLTAWLTVIIPCGTHIFASTSVKNKLYAITQALFDQEISNEND